MLPFILRFQENQTPAPVENCSNSDNQPLEPVKAVKAKRASRKFQVSAQELDKCTTKEEIINYLAQATKNNLARLNICADVYSFRTKAALLDWLAEKILRVRAEGDPDFVARKMQEYKKTAIDVANGLVNNLDTGNGGNFCNIMANDIDDKNIWQLFCICFELLTFVKGYKLKQTQIRSLRKIWKSNNKCKDLMNFLNNTISLISEQRQKNLPENTEQIMPESQIEIQPEITSALKRCTSPQKAQILAIMNNLAPADIELINSDKPTGIKHVA